MQVSPSTSALKKHAGEASQFLGSLSNEMRLLILCHLTEATELSVGEIVARVGLSQSALSQHLAKLRAEGLVETRRQAQTILYHVCDPKAARVLTLLHDLFCTDRPRRSNDKNPRNGRKGGRKRHKD